VSPDAGYALAGFLACRLGGCRPTSAGRWGYASAAIRPRTRLVFREGTNPSLAGSWPAVDRAAATEAITDRRIGPPPRRGCASSIWRYCSGPGRPPGRGYPRARIRVRPSGVMTSSRPRTRTTDMGGSRGPGDDRRAADPAAVINAHDIRRCAGRGFWGNVRHSRHLAGGQARDNSVGVPPGPLNGARCPS
jgi:hypothetical protein